MTIGALSAETGVPVDTIRYYERIGVLPRPPRRPSGVRDYNGADAASRLRFVRRAQALGFSLAEAGRLLAISDGGDGTASDVRKLAAERLAGLDARITELVGMRDALAPLVALCPSHGPVGGCPILVALAAGSGTDGNPGQRSGT